MSASTRGCRDASFSVQLCNGCCCGTEAKHPDVDHAGQRLRLGVAASRGGGRFRVVDCVGECSHSNVVIVRRGRRRIWLGGVLGDEQQAAIVGWIAAGAPEPMPEAVSVLCFHPGDDRRRSETAGPDAVEGPVRR